MIDAAITTTGNLDAATMPASLDGVELGATRRRRLPEWEIKSEADLDRVLSQAVIQETPRGPVLRLKEFADSEVVENRVDAQADTHLELDPEWKNQGERGRGAQLLFAAGLEKKAYRYAECCRTAERTPCSSYPDSHKFFKRRHCGSRFCEYCGDSNRRRLHGHYVPLLVSFLRDKAHVPGFTLARMNWTLRSDGEVPTTEEIQKFNEAIRRTLKRAVRKFLQVSAEAGNEWASGALQARKSVYGVLFCDEVGYEERGHTADRKAGGLNLHAHGLYYGPFSKEWRQGWEIIRDIWQEETKRAFGEESYGFYVTHLKNWRSDPVREIQHALNHMLKYVSKCPAKTPERMVELEKAFDGARRIHSGGIWFKLPKPTEEERGCGYCPLCEAAGIRSSLYLMRRFSSNGGGIPDYWPVEMLEAEGWRDLEAVRQEVGRSRILQFNRGSP